MRDAGKHHEQSKPQDVAFRFNRMKDAGEYRKCVKSQYRLQMSFSSWWSGSFGSKKSIMHHGKPKEQ